MTKRLWSNGLIWLGALLLLIAGGIWGYTQFSSRPTPTRVAQTSSPTSTPILAAATNEPSATPLPNATTTHSPTPSVSSAVTSMATSLPATQPSTATTMPTLTASPTPSITIRPSRTPTTASAPATPNPPRLSIPRIEVNAHIVEVTWHVLETNDGVFAEWDTAPANEIGHHANSADPGTPGNCVMAGHGQDGDVLARLDELAVGDEIWITTESGQARYLVSQILRLAETGVSIEERLQNATYLQDTQDARLTLISCWPGWAYTHRIVIIARLGG